MGRTYPFLAGEVACHKTSLSFVDSLWEMLGPLLAGIPTTVLTDEVVRDPERFVAALAESAVTRIWLVPALLRTVLDTPGDLAERLPRLRFWVSSGEGLPAELLERFERRLPGATLYNLYGTSEVWDATWWDPATDGSRGWRTPIGRPIDNVTVRVLDRNRALVPIGVQGELYVGGAGLARGYLADPQLTADRFVADPLQPGSTLYRSLDLALWRPSGQLEFVARADALLKIRGYRIDPTEVEDALMSLPEVGGAAVVAREDGSAGPRLVAYLVPRGPAELDITDVRRALAEHLPQYMLPASVVWLPAFPVTPSGKIDRTRLPRQSDTARSRRRHLQAPRDDAERTITAVWEDVLQTQVGTQDNFFDLGGHSLLLVKVHDRLRSLLGVELSITDLFRYPTVASLAAHCARHAPPPPTTDQVPSPDALVLPMTPTAVGAAR